MSSDLDRIADATITCALSDDDDALTALIAPLDDSEVRRLVSLIASRAAEALTGWAGEAGATPQDALHMWRNALLRAQRHEIEGDQQE
jgi:hypothetical protein